MKRIFFQTEVVTKVKKDMHCKNKTLLIKVEIKIKIKIKINPSKYI